MVLETKKDPNPFFRKQNKQTHHQQRQVPPTVTRASMAHFTFTPSHSEKKSKDDPYVGASQMRVRRPDGTLVNEAREGLGMCPATPKSTFCYLEDGVAVTDSPDCMAAQEACNTRLETFCGAAPKNVFQACVLTRPDAENHPNVYEWVPESDGCGCGPGCC